MEIRDNTDKWYILNNEEGSEVIIWRRFKDCLVNIAIYDSGELSISNITQDLNTTFLKFTTLEELIEIVK